MASVPLYRRDGSVRAHAIVDAEDLELVSAFRWYLSNSGYAHSRAGGPRVLMHRLVLGLDHGSPLHGDHIDGNTLDNRRRNLRVANHAENMQNYRRRTPCSRTYRNVEKHRSRWRVRVTLHGKRHVVGSFETEIEAALAAEKFRLEQMPFAMPDATIEELESACA